MEDPDLVRDLQKAGVEFTGVRPGFMSQFLWAWVMPIAAMVLLWRFLSRRMGSIGQGIMSFRFEQSQSGGGQGYRGDFQRRGGLR